MASLGPWLVTRYQASSGPASLSPENMPCYLGAPHGSLEGQRGRQGGLETDKEGKASFIWASTALPWPCFILCCLAFVSS